jgi:outer membrane protein OmpA-like peptidoglycan-associated protein
VTHIVVNFRREDVPVEARRLRDSLSTQLGAGALSLSEDETTPRRQLGAGDVVVAVIGPRWLELMRGRAARGERDEVRAEIATALRRGLKVVPVRVGRADQIVAMPRPEDLPDDIRALAHLKSAAVAAERVEADGLAIAQLLRPVPAALSGERLPGNSMAKMWLWAAGVMAATVVFANALHHVPIWLGLVAGPQIAGQTRPSLNLPAWTGEGRIRRAIEAALAKGRRPEEARRCQSSLIAATETGTILFQTARAELDERSNQTLDRLAQIIKDCPDFGIEIEGHTDNMGEPAANQRLSERRANAVRDYLVRAGVQSGSLVAAGFGDTRPVAPNDTAANMARNRRIDFNIIVR